MTRDDIIRMAREVRADRDEGVWLGVWLLTPDELERFAALVAAHEREECAKLCDQRAEGWLEVRNARTIDEGCMYSAAKAEAMALAAAIRTRGQS